MRKILKELKSQNILYYIFAFSAIIILIITVMGAYLYNFYYRTIYADFAASNAEHVRAQATRHENDIQVINDIAIQMELSSNSTKFKLSDAPEKAERLEKQLYQYTMVSQFFEMIIYYYHEDSYVFNHSTSLDRNYFLEQACILEKTDAENFSEELKSKEKGLRVLPEQKIAEGWVSRYMPTEGNIVIYFLGVAPAYRETMLFYVPASYYDALMEDAPENHRVDFILYNGQVIVSRGSFSVEHDELLALAKEDMMQRRVKLGKEYYLMTLEKGKSGLVYCSLQSMDIFYNKILSGQWGIIILLIVLAIPVTLLVLIASRRLTAKVRNLNKMLDTGEESYNITDIESGIQLLVASREQREKESRLLKRTYFVRRFVRSDFNTPEEVKLAAVDAGFDLGKGIFAVVLLGKRSDSNDNKAHLEMLEIIKNEPGLDGDGVHLVGSGQSLFALFADTEEGIAEVVSKIFVVGKESYEEFVMSISNYHTMLTEGSTAFLEADTAFDNRFLQDNSKIIRFGEIKADQPVNVLSDAYLQRLEYAMKSRDKEAVKQSIEDICRRMTEASPSLYTFRVTYNNILHILVTEWKGQSAEAEGLYNVFTLSQCLTIQDFNDLLWDACRTVIDSSPEELAATGCAVVGRAMAYIQENYASSDLTMAALADYLQVSSVTLAVVFKNAMGMRPSDYLANLRMEKARELLTTTNMLIYEISLAVGYEDDHVFTRRFKKYTGMTPGQYRDNSSGFRLN